MTTAADTADTARAGATAPSRLAPLRRFARGYAARPGGVAGLAVLVVMIAAALAAPAFIHPSDLDVINASGPSLAPPSLRYPLGTDQPGRSVLLLTIWGARPSLAIGVIATVCTIAIGAVFGLLAGHFGGIVGRVLMAVTDWFLALPQIVLAISLAAVLGQGDASITIAIAVTTWPQTARIVRAQTLAVEARPFVERAHALGAGHRQVMIRQVLPNVMPLILVSSTLTVSGAILTETTLQFLGLGNPTDVSWGGMLNQAIEQGAVSDGAWWYLLPPGIAILLVVLGFTLTGRAIENVLNPRAGTR
ncbi:MAG: ABC transporter permease [Nocardiopsaceae bacterium]|nr:ABC transporter permease [Nocardiopsaceae bacterium]